MCFHTYSMDYNTSFSVYSNESVFLEELNAGFVHLLGSAWFEVYLFYYDAGPQIVSFEFVVYYWATSEQLISDIALNFIGTKAVEETSTLSGSDSVTLTVKTTGAVCNAYVPPKPNVGQTLSSGQKAGIAIGAVAGGTGGAAALGGVAAAAYLLYRHMNRAPVPEQLASGDTAFADHIANDNKLFSDNSYEVHNELYSEGGL